MKAIGLKQINLKQVSACTLDQIVQTFEELGYEDYVDFSCVYITYDSSSNSYRRFTISIYNKKMLQDIKVKELLLEHLI